MVQFWIKLELEPPLNSIPYQLDPVKVASSASSVPKTSSFLPEANCSTEPEGTDNVTPLGTVALSLTLIVP